jgi:hypothetical protein
MNLGQSKRYVALIGHYVVAETEPYWPRYIRVASTIRCDDKERDVSLSWTLGARNAGIRE